MKKELSIYKNNNNADLYIFSVLLMIAPLLKGLFNEFTFFMVIFSWFIFFVYHLCKKRSEPTLSNIILILFTLTYLFGIFTSYNLRSAVIGFFKTFFYVTIFIYAASISEPKEKTLIRKAILIGVTFTAIWGILSAIGLISYPGFLHNRITSTIMYPNTLAILLVAAVFLSLPEIIDKGDKWVYFVSYICLVCLVGTLSRGGLLIYVVLLFFIFAVIANDIRKRLLSRFIICINLPALVVGASILRLKGFYGLSVFIIGSIIIFVFLKTVEYSNKKQIRIVMHLLLGFCLLVGIYFILDARLDYQKLLSGVGVMSRVALGRTD